MVSLGMSVGIPGLTAHGWIPCPVNPLNRAIAKVTEEIGGRRCRKAISISGCIKNRFASFLDTARGKPSNSGSSLVGIKVFTMGLFS